jgi:hypothetical protein
MILRPITSSVSNVPGMGWSTFADQGAIAQSAGFGPIDQTKVRDADKPSSGIAGAWCVSRS